MRHLPVLLLLVSAASLAIELPNFDTFGESRDVRPLPDTKDFDGHVASLEQRLGVPTFFWAATPAPGTRSPRDQGLSIEQAARRFLFAHAGLYRADPAQLAEAAMVRLHDTGQGVIIATFEKRVGGVSVFRDRLNVAMNQRLELVALTGYLSPASLKQSTFKLAASTALASAWFNLLGTPVEPVRFVEGALDEAGFRLFTSTLEQPFSGRAKKVLYPLTTRLVPAWHLELDVAGPGETSSSMYAVVVSAEDGTVLSRKNLRESEQFSYRVWAESTGLFLPDDGPQGNGATPHPAGTPNGFTPAFVAPSLVTLQNGDISTNDPWLAAGATQTTGNNVDAYADLAAPDGFGAGDLRATTTSPRTFDRVYDVTAQPNASSAQQQAGITQLFFDINQLHDWFYDRGFNEAAGNAQTDNFSRGGAGNDSIKAEAQDVGGTNNANMSTPSDGSRPRMQMYVWTPSGPSSVIAAPGGTYVCETATNFGPQTFNLTAPAVLAVDAVGPANDGCTAIPGAIGRIVVVDRGNCTFAEKVIIAQQAGATGVVVVNNVAGPPASMGGTDPNVTIASLMISQADGAALKANLASGAVNVTLSRTSVPRRAGEIDNTVVGHEWGHYLSNRLISDATGLTNNQGRSMGEGWGDTIAMLLTVRENDLQVSANGNWAGTYGTAVYAELGTRDAAYFGLRRYPYSTDFAKNPLTFHHIDDSVAAPTGVPANSGGGNNAEVHNSGELWAVTMWECYAALLRDTPRLTFDQARDRMVRYLVAGLKLTPVAPTFTEARDALLAAAAATDLADYRLLAGAFARRGLGILAVSPSRTSTTHAGVVESFATGNQLVFVGAQLDDEALYCDRDGVLDVGERGRLRLTLRNVGIDTLTATTATLSSTTAGVTIANPNLTFGSSAPFTQTDATTELTLTGLTGPTVLDLTLTFTDPALVTTTGHTATMQFRVNSDAIPASSAIDDAESGLVAWTFARDSAISTAFDWRRKTISPAQSVWFGLNPPARADISLVSPPLNVANTGSLGIVLNHRWDFEADATTNFDGAVIEITTNGGAAWTDLGTAIAGYTGTLGGSGSNNPLVGRSALTGKSPGHPAFTTSTLDLGTTYAGQTVQVRFRIGADQGSAGAGWDLDSIAFTGITNTPFPSLATDRALCINRPPVANAGVDQTADERSQVTLSSMASTDLDNDVLTPTWTQLTGPAVTLTSSGFTAPEVTADTALTFQLVVNDGTVDSAPDTVEVTVRQVNRAPIAIAGAGQQVDERTQVTLTGSGTDPDGDAVTFSWTQVNGPVVVLSGETTPMATFTAPEIGPSSVHLVFALTVSDGTLLSASSLLDVEVLPVNRAPTLTLSFPASVPEREQVQLTAVGVDEDADVLFYQWRQISGPQGTLIPFTTLEDFNQGFAMFTAPEVMADAPAVFEVTVSDGTLTATATGTVVITNANRPPIAVVAGASRNVKPGEIVQLDASGSSDPDGDAITFSWAQSDGATVALEGATSPVATFTMPTEGALTFNVTVSDASGATGTGSLTLTAEAANPPKPMGCGCTSSSAELFMGVLMALGLLRRRRSREGWQK